MPTRQSLLRLTLPVPTGVVVGWAAGATAGAPAPLAWSATGLGFWLSVPFNWSFIVVGGVAALGTYFGVNQFFAPDPTDRKLDAILALLKQGPLTPDQAAAVARVAEAGLPATASSERDDGRLAYVRELTRIVESPDAKVRAAGALELRGKPEAAIAALVALAEREAGQAAARYREAAALAAPRSVEQAKSLYARAADLDPRDFGTWIELARLHRSIGSLPEARRCAERAAQNARTNSESSVALLQQGEIAYDEGEFSAARVSCAASLAIEEGLAASDLSNSELHHGLFASQYWLGNIALAQGDLPAARANCTACFAIAQGLAALEPGNSERQIELSISFSTLGDIARAEGDLLDARANYVAGIAIVERLAAQDPGNGRWQRILSVSQSKLGDIARAESELGVARESYAASLAIHESLAARDPNNGEWQRDLFIGHARLAQFDETAGDVSAAIRSFERAEAVMAKLVSRRDSHPGFARDLAQVRADLMRLRALS